MNQSDRLLSQSALINPNNFIQLHWEPVSTKAIQKDPKDNDDTSSL